jgi:uncharacterized protein (TIGR03437 family)
MLTFTRVLFSGLFLAALLTGDDGASQQTPTQVFKNTHPGKPLALLQTRYRLRAGEMTRIAAAAETRDFMLKAKTRRVEIVGTEVHGFVVGPSIAGDEVLLAASLTMRPGEYSLTVSVISEAGEVRATPLSVVLDPLQTVPSTATQPPVVLLNGWQVCRLDSGLTGTFGSLGSDLVNSGGVPVVYFFDNCVECSTGTDCAIEVLGNSLLQVLNLIRYDNGAPVPQVDLVGHSMGGLIARAYLAGLQADGTLNPPPNPRVRKLVEIATPNFGSFIAEPVAGTQAKEMIPGSAFLWNLATWNQRGDDLRGVDALAIIGNAGYWPVPESSNDLLYASDGVVSLTSASLGFARDQSRTRILRYCHTDPSVWNSLLGPMDCSGFGGIANVDQAPETGAIVLSFLENTSTWEFIGTPNQTEYGGIYFALENAAGTLYTPLESASFGSQWLQGGANNAFYYDEFANGTGTLEATSTAGQATSCGSFSVPGGYYSVARCKYSPSIYSVQSSLSTGLPGLTVASGSTITISGVGFSSATGTALLANGASLSGQIVSDQEITAFLPSSYSGLVSLGVSNSAGQDYINIMAAPAPTIAVAPTSLTFQYAIGGVSPSGQLVQITNSGGGVLNWTATSSASWLTVASGTAPSTLTVSVVPSGLAAGTYNASIQISSAGASNTPVTVPVTLIVAPAPPSLAVSPKTLAFNYTVGASLPAARSVSITNTGGGSLSWTASASANWIGVSPPSGTAPATLSISVNPAGLSPGSYGANVQIAATGATGSPVAVAVTLGVQASPSAPTITAVVNAAGFQAGISSGAWTAIYGTNLASTTRSWRNDDFVNGKLPTQLDGVSATIDGKPAALCFVSPTQINVQVPDDSAVGSVPVQVTSPLGIVSATAQMQQFSPGLFTFDGKYLAAQHADYSYVGKPGLISGVTTTPAQPGEVVILWGTGVGPSNPATPAGELVTQAEPLANQVTVSIGGVQVNAQWAGISGAGLWQINVQVPSSLPDGDALVVAAIGGVRSQDGAFITVGR